MSRFSRAAARWGIVIWGCMIARDACASLSPDLRQTHHPAVASARTAPTPASKARKAISDAHDGSENIEVHANRGSYTAPTSDVWGKSGVALKDIPHSISVITQERMQDSNMLTMTDAMRQVNGIRVLPGSTANSNFYSRGYQLTTSLDGTPNAAGTLNNASFDLSMYDRIEVLRGSAGLLQGAGGAGGVVNEVTKKPGRDFSVSGAATIGSFDNYRADLDLNVPLNRSRTLRFRTADLFEDNDFFYNYSHSRKWQAYGALEWDITPTTTFLVSHAAQQQDITAPYYGLPVTTDDTLWYGGRSANPSQPWGYSNYMTQQTIVSLSQKLGRDWILTARGTFYDQGYDMLYNEPWTTINAKTGLLTYEDQGIAAQRGSSSSRSADIYATGAFHLLGRTHHILAGFNYNSYDQYVAYANVSGSGVYPDISINNTAAVPAPSPGSISYAPSSGGAEGSDDFAYQWGFYGQLRLEPVRHLSLILGGRISRFSEHSRDAYPSPRGRWSMESDIHAQLTPYLGAVYQITPNLSWYASYASIFTPSVGDLRYHGGGIAPQVGNQIETGFKGGYFQGRLNVSAALFRMESTNQPLSDPQHIGFYITTGPIRRQGWEAQIDGEILPGLSVSIGYTYLDTKLSNPSSPDFGEAFSPHHMFKSWVHYTLPGGRLKGLSLGAGIDASSNLRGGYPTTLQGGYMTIDSMIGYAINRNLRLQLNANNLTDRYYYERASGVWQFNFPAAPRNFMATFRATY